VTANGFGGAMMFFDEFGYGNGSHFSNLVLLVSL